MYTAPMAPEPWTRTLGGMAIVVMGCDSEDWWSRMFEILSGIIFECVQLGECMKCCLIDHIPTVYLSMPIMRSGRLISNCGSEMLT